MYFNASSRWNSFDEQAFQRPGYLGRVVLGELIFYS